MTGFICFKMQPGRVKRRVNCCITLAVSGLTLGLIANRIDAVFVVFITPSKTARDPASRIELEMVEQR